jgi:hypothetical protein
MTSPVLLPKVPQLKVMQKVSIFQVSFPFLILPSECMMWWWLWPIAWNVVFPDDSVSRPLKWITLFFLLFLVDRGMKSLMISNNHPWFDDEFCWHLIPLHPCHTTFHSRVRSLTSILDPSVIVLVFVYLTFPVLSLTSTMLFTFISKLMMT